MKEKRNYRILLSLPCLFAASFIAFGCGGGGDPTDNDTGTDTNTSTGTESAEDTDTDAGIDGGVDAGSPADMCDHYPPPDDNFLDGAIVRNYTFFDRKDAETKICEFAESGYKLMLLKIGTGT